MKLQLQRGNYEKDEIALKELSNKYKHVQNNYLHHHFLHKQEEDDVSLNLSKTIKKLMIPFGVSMFTVFSCFFSSSLPVPSSITSFSSQVNAAETVVSKQVSKFKVKETLNGVKFFEVQKGSGESPHDGDLIIINYIGYLSDGTVFDSQHAPGKKPLAFQYGKNQVIPGLEDALKTMQPGGERQVLVPPSMGYGDRGVCLDKDDVNKEKCLIPPGSNLKYQLQLKRVAVSPI